MIGHRGRGALALPLLRLHFLLRHQFSKITSSWRLPIPEDCVFLKTASS